MFSVLLWKEYREQRMVWVVLAFASGAAVWSLSSMAAAGWLGTAPDIHEWLYGVAVCLVGMYGLVSGAMMFAGERENGTLSYLDALPVLRRRVWQGKFVAGVLLVLGQIVLMMLLGAGISLFEAWWAAGLTFAAMVLFGFYGLAWGMLFSSFGRSVMNMILLSIPGQAVWSLVGGLLTLILAVFVANMSGVEPDFGLYAAGLFVVTMPAALVVSALVFTRLDRSRSQPVSNVLPLYKQLLHRSWSTLFWLTWRQTRGFAAGIAVFALFLGFVLLLNSLILWPVATLIVGVLCGATAFADEQQGPFRFLGDQRLPLFRLWLVKVGLRFAVAVAAALLVLAPCFVRALMEGPDTQYYPHEFPAHVFHSDLVVDLIPPGLFASMWLAYGFSTGCLFGLLFRHGLASGVFALFTCALAAALWVPSLLCGGLLGWQVFGPPVLIFLSTSLLMHPWAAGRIASWTTAMRLIPFVVLAGLWIAGGLWYRVLEIPDVPMKMDLDAFRASLPTPAQAEGGELFHSACLRFEDRRTAIQSEQGPPGAGPGMPGMAPPGGAGAMPPGQPGVAGAMPGIPGPAPAVAAQAPVLTLMEQANETLEHGWPADDKALKAWLDKMYEGEWAIMLKKAADLPTGPFDDVRNSSIFTLLPATQASRDVAVVLAAHGLQRQAAGDDEAYVENLRIGLGLSRSLRDRTPAVDVLLGRVVQTLLLNGLDRWLEKLQGRPDLIQKALTLLSRELDETADDAKYQKIIRQLAIKNTAENPIPLLQMYIANGIGQRNQYDPNAYEEAIWVATAWLIPWEREREARLLRIVLNYDSPQGQEQIYPANRFGPLPFLSSNRQMPDSLGPPGRLCEARAMQLKLALRWYQADNGKPADNLDELVPKYLPSIPVDPFNAAGKPFRYRLSHGEKIYWPTDLDAEVVVGGAAAPAVVVGGAAVPAAPADAPPGMVFAAPAPAVRKIPPGQGILWSVGQDGIDDGGHSQSRSPRGETAPGEDFIFLVPMPPQAK